MEIINIVWFIFCLILFAIGFYNIGRRKTVQEKEVKYNEELAFKEHLQWEIEYKKQELDSLSQNYENKKADIAVIDKIIEDKHKEKVQNLEQQYKIRNKELDQAFNQYKETLYGNFQEKEQNYLDRISELGKELKKLSDTKAATIEALQREKLIQEEKDKYRIALSKEEENDIKILQDVRRKLENKRVLDMLIWQTFVRDKLKQLMIFIFPKKDMCGIYKITNLIDQKCYIGQARKLQDRINQHIKHALYIDCPQGNKLYEAMQKEGIDNFTIELLEECEPEQLNEKEKYYIKLYNAVDWGYNKLAGNNG